VDEEREQRYPLVDAATDQTSEHSSSDEDEDEEELRSMRKRRRIIIPDSDSDDDSNGDEEKLHTSDAEDGALMAAVPDEALVQLFGVGGDAEDNDHTNSDDYSSDMSDDESELLWSDSSCDSFQFARRVNSARRAAAAEVAGADVEVYTAVDEICQEIVRYIDRGYSWRVHDAGRSLSRQRKEAEHARLEAAAPKRDRPGRRPAAAAASRRLMQQAQEEEEVS
jgi:hypothetical protein